MTKSDGYVYECVLILAVLADVGKGKQARQLRVSNLSIRQTVTRLTTLHRLGWVCCEKVNKVNVYQINGDNELALAMARGFSGLAKNGKRKCNRVTADTAMSAVS